MTIVALPLSALSKCASSPPLIGTRTFCANGFRGIPRPASAADDFAAMGSEDGLSKQSRAGILCALESWSGNGAGYEDDCAHSVRSPGSVPRAQTALGAFFPQPRASPHSAARGRTEREMASSSRDGRAEAALLGRY